MMSAYEYVNENGRFRLENPERYSYLYFPLANEAGVMTSMAPDMAGGCKMSQNTFLLPPVSSENLHNDKSARNFWCKINGDKIWSLNGRSAAQQARLFDKDKEETSVEAGFMIHQLTRTEKETRIQAQLTSTVPCDGQWMELTKVSLSNQSDTPHMIQLITAIPIFARSADNIRDHRHVTALLNRIETSQYGVTVCPTLTFDERGHLKNEMVYGVFAGSSEEQPEGFFPVLEAYIGEGGNLENPEILHTDLSSAVPAGTIRAGYEALGGICFSEYKLMPGERREWTVIAGFANEKEQLVQYAEEVILKNQFNTLANKTVGYWQQKVNIRCQTSDSQFDQWLQWVCFQPMLRRIYGCSFMPHHDYGKGGRGWRDLWQDCLALIMMNPEGVREMLINNFGGVRLDGTNATIIGNKPGEFIADRNNITRVWMDHGVWPLLTTDLYIQQTGDMEILFEEALYFKDRQVGRGEYKDEHWEAEDGSIQRDKENNVYSGTVFEHLLIQNLAAFYDVGIHNHIRIRGADWNDALDLAEENGESVAFTAMYGDNLERLAEYALLMGVQKRPIIIGKELEPLLYTNENAYEDVNQKTAYLSAYCSACSHYVSGEKVVIEPHKLAQTLREKGKWIKTHIRRNEWLTTHSGDSWFNGYYDNHQQRLEGDHPNGPRMMLTSQVFTAMSKTADDEQLDELIRSADKYLYAPEVGGYRLNTDFSEVKMDMGRMFGFAYGHKENGAVFSHMTTMFGNALYQRERVRPAYKAIHTLYAHCADFEKSRIYPGIPEYIDAGGRGMYHYLTGAASWMMLTIVREMFGVKGNLGNLMFSPRLIKEQFKNGRAQIWLLFAGRSLSIEYMNDENLDYGEYQVKKIVIDKKQIHGDMVSRIDLLRLEEEQIHKIQVILGKDEVR